MANTLAALLATSISVASGLAQGATSSPHFTVSANLSTACGVSAAPFMVGSADSGATAAQIANSVVLTCSKGATITAVSLEGAEGGPDRSERAGFGPERLQLRSTVVGERAWPPCDLARAGSGLPATALLPVLVTNGAARPMVLCATVENAHVTAQRPVGRTVRVTVTYD